MILVPDDFEQPKEHYFAADDPHIHYMDYVLLPKATIKRRAVHVVA